jgi:hypothetical protein
MIRQTDLARSGIGRKSSKFPQILGVSRNYRRRSEQVVDDSLSAGTGVPPTVPGWRTGKLPADASQLVYAVPTAGCRIARSGVEITDYD